MHFTESLKKNKDFKIVYNKGKSCASKYTVLFYIKNDLSFNSTSFLASKKVGNSVQRNRARRLLRESYRSLASNIKEGYDLIIIARNTIVSKKEMDVEKSLKDCLLKAQVLKDENSR